MLNSRLSLPKTDTLAKICAVLKMPVSSVIEFKGIKTNPYFIGKELPYAPPMNPQIEVTYKPLWNFIERYNEERIAEGKEERSANALFDQIEPRGRKLGLGLSETDREKGQSALGYGEGYVPKIQRTRKAVTKGLT